jgi:hypothetical protein
MKRTFSILSAAVVAAALASPAMAQTPATNGPATTGALNNAVGAMISPTIPPPDHDTTRREVRRFDNLEDQRPEAVKELYKDPTLVNNPDYLAKHPGMQEWMTKHPQAATELKEHPKEFLARERNFDRREDRYEHRHGDERFERHDRDDRIGRGEVGRFHKGYRDHHPEAAEQLSKDPNLVNNKEWVEKHPGFRDYTKDHPTVREDRQEHPYKFEARERAHERWEHRHGADKGHTTN